MIDRRSEQQSGLTPEQEQERLSTDGMSSEDPLRRVLVGGTGQDLGHHEREDGMGTAPRYVDRDLTDDELLEVWESTTTGVNDSTLPTFSDRESFIRDVLQRLGR